MDSNSILAKTAKGTANPKGEGGDLNYDAVRLLRLVNGKSTVAELRAQFTDLTDTRFQKAAAALESKELVNILPARETEAGDDAAAHKLDKQSQDLAQIVVQTLDFTRLKRSLANAVKPSPSAEQSSERKPPPAPEPAAVKKQPQQALADLPDAVDKTKLEAELRPVVEKELRAKLIAVLRPQIEQELRQKLVAALRPVLEAEIRTKLAAALEPRIAQEQAARGRGAGATAEEPGAASTATSTAHLRLLECIRETVFQTDLAGNSSYVNARWTKLTGYGPDETLCKPLAQFFVPEDQPGVAEYLAGIAHGSAVPVAFEARLARKTGAPLRVTLRAAIFTTESGANAGVCGTLRGIS